MIMKKNQKDPNTQLLYPLSYKVAMIKFFNKFMLFLIIYFVIFINYLEDRNLSKSCLLFAVNDYFYP